MRLTTLRTMLTGPRARAPRGPARKALTSLWPEALEPRRLPAVSIVLDYSYDANGFFNSQARRDVMRLAADSMTSALTDSLAAIVPNPAAGDTWSARFPDPATGVVRAVNNLTVPANTLIVYVGGGALPGTSEAGEGSSGGYSASGSSYAWLNNVAARGKAGALAAPPTSFGPWGGSIRFDATGATNWYFGASLAGLAPNQTDFLSVAEHELGHVLGLGSAGSWDARVAGGVFSGPTVNAVNGGRPAPVNPAGDHWAQGVGSNGGPALMDPALTSGTRALATTLDLAALRDIGWQINSLPLPSLQFSTPAYAVSESGGAAVVTVTRSGMPAPTSVVYATVDGTARAGVDYTATSGVLNFAYGELVKTFTVPILRDNLADGQETVNLVLGGPANGSQVGTPATATLTIVDATPTVPSRAAAPGDFDADGRTDPGVFRTNAAVWTVQQTAAGRLTPQPQFGAVNLFDIPLVGDFDGVGHAEAAVFRPSTAQWFVLGPNGSRLVGNFGATNLYDIPVPGDYDGTGRTELAVFRPATAEWFVLGPGGVGRSLGTFGATNLYDIPVPGDYDGVGHTELAVFRPATAEWFVLGPGGVGRSLGTFGATNLYDIPAPGDYDGTGRTQMAVFRPATAEWFAGGPSGGRVIATLGATNDADLPIEASVASLARLGVVPGGTALSAARSAAPRAVPAAAFPVPLHDGLPMTAGPFTIATPPKRKALRTSAQDAWSLALDELAPASV